MDQKAVLLATIESALKLQPSAAALSAERVSELGQWIDLTAKETFELLRQLSADGEIDLEWGGKVRSIRHRPEAISINLGPNATYVGHNVNIQNSAVGSSVQVQMQNTAHEDLIRIVAKLAAVLDNLGGITAEHQQCCQRLIDLTKAMQQQLLRNEKHNKERLGQQLDEADKALSVLEKAGKVGAAVVPRLPLAWEMLRHAYQTLSAYLGGL